jgi:excisionase family DNA binding protein
MTQQFTHINETAKALNISPSTLYRLARENQVPHVRIGKRYLFLIDDIVP